MQTLSVGTSTQEVAQGLRDALIGFQPALTRDGDGWRVTVMLNGDGPRVADVLEAFRRHVAALNDGAARAEPERKTA